MSPRFHTPLTAAEQTALGLPDPAPVALADRVHHDELDALNHVNNTVYFKWFERLRIHFAAHYDLALLDRPDAPRTVIRSAEIRYVEEMHLADTYVVTARCTAMRRTSYTLAQQVWAAGRLRADFSCVMVLLAPHSPGRVPIPDPVRARLIADGASLETAPV